MHLLTFLLPIVLSTSDQPTFPKSLDVPYVPTPPEVVQTMLDMAKIKRGDTVYDLGSGDGRVVVTAARKYGARGLGVDLDPERIAEARANARRNAVSDRVEFRQGDLFGVDLRKATVLTMYLLPEVNMKLRPRLIEQLRPGTRVVSHNYNLGDWQPDAIRNVGEDHIVYLWIVPARVSGTWRWELPLPAGAQQYSLDVDQHFQQVRGNLTRSERRNGTENHTVANNFRDPTNRAQGNGNRAVSITDAKLAGDQLTFTASDSSGARPVTMQYRGTVSAGTITGSIQIVDGSSVSELPWVVTRGQPADARGR